MATKAALYLNLNSEFSVLSPPLQKVVSYTGTRAISILVLYSSETKDSRKNVTKPHTQLYEPPMM